MQQAKNNAFFALLEHSPTRLAKIDADSALQVHTQQKAPVNAFNVSLVHMPQLSTRLTAHPVQEAIILKTLKQLSV